ncbi:MAG: T9SS type A sorting domain-containing protein [Ignavibacteria bacterium]|nr:T9SS type A sorting domain-containing protein [Ignavibacteria bacterium]
MQDYLITSSKYLRYTVDFNGSNLSSGIYFYKIETNGFIATKKMVLLK